MLALASSVPFEFQGGTIWQGSLPLTIMRVDAECSFQEAEADSSACWLRLEERGLWRATGENRARLLLVRSTQVPAMVRGPPVAEAPVCRMAASALVNKGLSG